MHEDQDRRREVSSAHATVGPNVGADVGALVGTAVGSFVGADVGLFVGADVGALLEERRRIFDCPTQVRVQSIMNT
jgi:uncharacterized protein YcfJ